MSKYIASIPLGDIERIQIYVNKSAKTLAEIKVETGADYLINGGLYQGAQAVCHLRADGRTYAKDPYTYWGYAWDTGPDITLRSVPAAERRNYICCVCLLRGGKAETLIYNRDVGGSRPRTAMGIKDGALCLYCTNSGRTPEELQAELLALGWESAVMLDGGGSSQCDLAGKRIVSNRKVHNLILVYKRKRAPSEPGDSDKEDKPMDGITRAIMTNSDCYKAGEDHHPQGDHGALHRHAGGGRADNPVRLGPVGCGGGGPLHHRRPAHAPDPAGHLPGVALRRGGQQHPPKL